MYFVVAKATVDWPFVPCGHFRNDKILAAKERYHVNQIYLRNCKA